MLFRSIDVFHGDFAHLSLPLGSTMTVDVGSSKTQDPLVVDIVVAVATTRWLGPDVGEGAASDAHELIERRREDVVRMACSGPHFVVLQQVGVDEHAQLSAVTKGRHAPCGFCNSSQSQRPSVGWPALVRISARSDLTGVD